MESVEKDVSAEGSSSSSSSSAQAALSRPANDDVVANGNGHLGHRKQEPSLLGVAAALPGAASQKVQDVSSKTFQSGKELAGSLSNAKSRSSMDTPATEGFETHPALSRQYLKTDPAFNPLEVAHRRPSPAVDMVGHSEILHGGAKRATKEIVGNMLHPRRAIIHHYQTKTAKRLSGASRPYTSPQSDREFLAAHDALFEAEEDEKDEKDIGEPRRTRANSAASRKGKHASKNERDSEIRGRQVGSDRDHHERSRLSPAALQRQKVEMLEAHRQSLAVAWLTGRHIKRVRLAPALVVDYPKFEDERFIERDDTGAEIRFKWERYIGELLFFFSQGFTARYVDEGVLEVPFDSVTLGRHIERLVMATEPWQSWFMEVRSIYRWDDPRRTGIWYGVFAYLWYTQHVVGFLVRADDHGPVEDESIEHNTLADDSAHAVRESLDRALDRGAQAFRWGELIDRHGREQWLDPLMNEVAPFIQLQLGDLAAFLEILWNFYHWRNPSKTAATLFFFAACLALTLFTDMEYCMKVFWFISINVFFLAWPVASRYPQYRFVVSPFRWTFWDIPTHPEWAVQFLQNHDVLRRAEMRDENRAHPTSAMSADVTGSDDDNDEEFYDPCETRERVSQLRKGIDTASYEDSVSFRVSHRGRQGHLILSSGGLRFVVKLHTLTSLNPTKSPQRTLEELWSYPFTSLVQLTKRHSPTTTKLAGVDPRLERLELELLVPSSTTRDGPDQADLPPTEGIDITYGEMRGMATRVETVDVSHAERDEIFNLIVGWSKARWQVISARSDPKKEKKGPKKKKKAENG